MKLSKNQLVDIKNIGKNLTIDEGLNNFTLFCYYLDQGAGQPPRSIQDFTTLMNEGAAGSTFHKISITPDTKSGYTSGNEDAILEGILLSISETLENTGAGTAIERLVESETIKIRTKAIIPKDNWLRIFRIAKVPKTITLPDGSVKELIDNAGKATNEYLKYEEQFIKNYKLSGSVEHRDIDGDLIGMDYTFIEINRALEKNWRTFFSTETLAPGGGTGGVGKEGKGVKRITIEFSKNPIINYLALNGTPDLTSSSYSTIELDYEQESDFKKNYWRPFLFNPTYFQVDKLKWNTPWVGEVNFAWSQVANTTSLSDGLRQVGFTPELIQLYGSDGTRLKSISWRSYFNDNSDKTLWKSNSRNRGFFNFVEKKHPLSASDYTDTQYLTALAEALNWGATANIGSEYWNEKQGLLRQAYISSGADWAFKWPAINYDVRNYASLAFRNKTTDKIYYDANLINNIIFGVGTSISVPPDHSDYYYVPFENPLFDDDIYWNDIEKQSIYFPVLFGLRQVKNHPLPSGSVLDKSEDIYAAFFGLRYNSAFGYNADRTKDFYQQFFNQNFKYREEIFTKFPQNTIGESNNNVSDPLVEKRTYSKIGTNTAYMALVYDGSTNLEKDIRDLIPTNIPGETFLYYNNIKIADASADYIYITIRQSGDDRATTRIRTSISPANFANAFWRKNELGNNDRYDKEDFLYTHRELGGAGDKNNRLRVVEIEGNLGTATNNSGFSEGITWTNNAITSSASTTIYRYPNIQLASDNFRTEKGERENGIWISPFDSALDAIPGQVEVYAPNLKENYKNKTIYGSDLSIFDNTSPNNYRPTALKEKYFDDFNTREISFTLKGDTGNGFKINSLYLGVYTRGDYKVKFYDHDGELIKEEIIPGSRGRIGRNTTTILQY